ncbi:Methylcrotonoyl-CoA carboxylase [Purpureocillium takamizusanense]|uniref:Methylcrotonoyl-CoA carboxylase n=1 Tax=Purpureocillium takamizusanense TaxID=2060973 RepID=A0A9Q8Q970_9HYPO|nr:Methylcrotonoyl-CoA carboxylase [Purpureocillium takamizusanense]UNI15027.1 Methylcrotonoyl-CoA carboxylase [Purpureocillium takamizusanense]
MCSIFSIEAGLLCTSNCLSSFCIKTGTGIPRRPYNRHQNIRIGHRRHPSLSLSLCLSLLASAPPTTSFSYLIRTASTHVWHKVYIYVSQGAKYTYSSSHHLDTQSSFPSPYNLVIPTMATAAAAAALPATQRAVVMTGKRQPLAAAEAPVFAPQPGEVVVRVAWTASTPLDLHRADGGLLVPSWPAQTGGGGVAGTVVALGGCGAGDGANDGDNSAPAALLLKGLRVGDRVMAFAFRGAKEANHQEYITIPAYLAGRIPDGLSLREACTVPVNLVTVFHTATADLELELPWPVPSRADWRPAAADAPVLVWGASSSVGIYAVQVLRHWGYRRILAVSSGRHHEYLRRVGATACFDYTKPEDVVSSILTYVGERGADGEGSAKEGPQIPYILDCIGSLDGTLRPLTSIAQRGSRVAVMLPVILKDATEDDEPEYEMDVTKCLPDKWAEGVILRGTRTHFYLQNEFFKERLQPEIIPALLANKIIEPNKQRVVEGADMVERAQNALSLLRSKAVSGERLVWKV